MTALDDLLNNLQDDDEDPAEDRTLHVRVTPDGPRVDFEVRESTRFDRVYPETTKSLVTQLPLPCGHSVTRDNPFGGVCQGKRFGWPILRGRCNREYCVSCAIPCPRCGVFVSANCHASPFRGQMVCRHCCRVLKASRFLRKLWQVVLHPFISVDATAPAEPTRDDWFEDVFGPESGRPTVADQHRARSRPRIEDFSEERRRESVHATRDRW